MLQSQDCVLSKCYQWKDTPQQTEKLFLEKFYLKTHELVLKSNSPNTNVAHGSVYTRKIGWAHGINNSTQMSTALKS